MAHRMVVARYGEALGWLAEIPAGIEVIVANKGSALPAGAVPDRVRVAARPNAGREGETYLWALAAATDGALEDTAADDGFTIFTQGDPFEHSPDFPLLLGNMTLWRDLQPLSWRWKLARNIPPEEILARERADHPGGARLRAELFSLCTWAPPGFDDPGAQWVNQTYRRLHGLPEGANIAAHFLAACGLADAARAASGHRLGCFAYGAIFAVRTRLLRAVPAAAVTKLTEATHAHPVYGYMLERLWLHLFGLPFLLPVEAAEAPLAAPAFAFKPPESQRAMRRRKAARLLRRIGRAVAGG